MLIVGLTGSIGMGKTTTAKLFRQRGVPVHDSDEAVHRFYESKDSEIVVQAFPSAASGGRLDRKRLAELVLVDRAALLKLEAIVHPIIRQKRAEFVDQQRRLGSSIIVLDIPLLFETNCQNEVDLVVVVDAPDSVQKSRVLARPGMTPDRLSAILANQMSAQEKRRRAHAIIDTSRGVQNADREVGSLLRALSCMTD